MSMSLTHTVGLNVLLPVNIIKIFIIVPILNLLSFNHRESSTI